MYCVVPYVQNWSHFLRISKSHEFKNDESLPIFTTRRRTPRTEPKERPNPISRVDQPSGTLLYKHQFTQGGCTSANEVIYLDKDIQRIRGCTGTCSNVQT